MNFIRRLGNEEQAAADQDDVAPRYSHAENGKERRGEAHEPGEAEEHDHAEDESEGEADLAGAAGLVCVEPCSEDRDEDEIVDPEHDLERGQRDERGPRIW